MRLTRGLIDMTQVAQVEAWVNRLQEHGYRSTASSRAVVEIVIAQGRVFSPEEIGARLHEKYPHVGRATVYRTLQKLETLGLIQRVIYPHDCQFYRAAPNGLRDLLVCQHCGDSSEFDGSGFRSMISSLEQQSGFILNHTALQLFGVCANCQPPTIHQERNAHAAQKT
jgi:Fur family ferric uptake transcriptional regulator